jgi:hypothetical protein
MAAMSLGLTAANSFITASATPWLDGDTHFVCGKYGSCNKFNKMIITSNYH